MTRPTLADSRGLRLATLAALYVAQGLPWGFVTTTLVAYLNNRGLELRTIGDLSVAVMLPWTLKFAWGPIIDRFSLPASGRRRPWILLAQALMIATLLALATLGDAAGTTGVLAAVLCVHNAFIALQDVATDSLAIEILPDAERGIANGLMSGGHYVGMLAGGAGLTWLLSRTDLATVVVVQAAALAGLMLFPALLRERSSDGEATASDPQKSDTGAAAPAPVSNADASDSSDVRSWTQLWNVATRGFATRSALAGAALALAIYVAQGVLIVAAPGLLMQELGWTVGSYAELASLTIFAAIGGALAGGALASVLGRKPVVAGATVLLGASWLGFASLESHWAAPALITGFALATSAVQAAMVAALYGLFMDLSLPRVAATHFVLYMALLNVSRTAGTYAAADIVTAVGYGGTYAAIGGLQVACALLLLPIDPQQVRRQAPGA